ncbi:unnamed protein product [Fusarium graminearum]|uniref:Chromosome 2, complete genome n=1 Tax=Gibberella zeae (strain ATCC MYA-4620 / CBS 123657 / FGSC 9075 / NRRL 31084 / PH-1) TaxID=229533 RepID=A0A0E0S1L3_GIBZE|nr:hypothetical protein FG05_35232 [Fusarium graminearum]CEF77388.1 unnamed protein product [Fusarium graminearum]
MGRERRLLDPPYPALQDALAGIKALRGGSTSCQQGSSREPM